MKTDSTAYKELCLQEKMSVDDTLLKAVDASSVSGELNVASTSLTVQTCEVLSKLVSLSETITKIDVSDCLLMPQALAVLLNPVKLSKIHTLQLKGNNIMGPSVHRVAALVTRSHKLKVLGLQWNNLGLCREAMSQFCVALTGNGSLEVLDLQYNQLDAECALLLSDMLYKNSTLRALDLSWNHIEHQGGQYLLTALQTNKTLMKLKLQGNCIPNDMLTALEQFTKHNASLLRLESNYRARTDLLAKHVQVISDQRSQELKSWAEKNQLKIKETEERLREMEKMLNNKQTKVEELTAHVIKLESELDLSKHKIAQMEHGANERDNMHTEIIKEKQIIIQELQKSTRDRENELIAMHEELKLKLDREKLKEDKLIEELNVAKDEKNKVLHEVSRLKEDINFINLKSNETMEAQQKLFQERLEHCKKDFESRLQDTVADADRAAHTASERISHLEKTVETLDRAKSDINSQLLTERAKWAEEKANIFLDVKEKEAYKMLALNDKIDHMKEEKSYLETQLAATNTTIAQLQRENASLLADLADCNRKVLHTQEDLSNEKLMVQRLQNEKSEDIRIIESLKSECEQLKNELLAANKKISELNVQHEAEILTHKKEAKKLKEKIEIKDKEISLIRTEEMERANALYLAVNKYLGSVSTLQKP